MTHTPQKQFILASASPRRKSLFTQAGYHFDIIPSNIDESAFAAGADTNSTEHTKLLAMAKAKTVAHLHPDRLVLGADTVVDFKGRIIGKPKDSADAENIIRLLFSAPHKVITAVAFIKIQDATEIVESETTIIYPRKLTEQQIAEHIKSNLWQGKAGAYGIQETGEEFIERIEGSFTNVMGLPMELVERLLKKLTA